MVRCQLVPCCAHGRVAISILPHRPLRSAAEGDPCESWARSQCPSTGRPGVQGPQCPCMNGPLPFPALVVQLSDTTCSLTRLPAPMRSALPSREALWCRTLRGPLATLGRRPARGRVYDSPGRYDDAANRCVYRTLERYDVPRLVRSAPGGPDCDRCEDDRASARRGNRPDRGPPSTAPERGPQGRRDDTERRRRRSPSPETARRLRYDAPDIPW